mgnify:CR=1 FL=1
MKVVENAIIVPIFTMIIIALISVGIYMHDRIIIRNMVSQISIEYEKESDITARKELIKRGERYAADRTMFLRDINIYDDRVYQQDESIVCSASFPVIGSYAGMSDICNISENVNKIVLGDNVVIGEATTTTPVIDGSSSSEKINLTINDITGIHGDITLGNNDDTLTIAKNYAYDGVIDLGNGTNDILNLSHSDEGTTHVKNEENTFNYKVHNVEEINLTGGHWHIDNTKTEITGDKVNLNISGELHVEVNSLGAGKGVETSMDGVGKDVNDFTVSAGEGIKFVVGDNFNALEPSYSFETEYKLGADTEIKGAVIFDTSASTVTED